MSVEPLTCPYCNAFAELPPGARDGQRITCTRCGEAFPLRGCGIISSPYGVRQAARLPSAPIVPPISSRPRLTLGLILVGMLLAAGVSLAFALYSQDRRRANDAGAGPPHKQLVFGQEPPTPPVAPSRLPGLGYLPSGTNIVLGVHVRQLREAEVGRKLLAEPIKTSNGELVLARLLGWAGVEIYELDHVVVGVRTEDVAVPRIIVVVRTRKPINRRDLFAKLQPEQFEGLRPGQTVYRFAIPGSPLRPMLWLADERTLVFDLLGRLDGVPERPREVLSHLPFEVRDALQNGRVPAGSVIWLAGTVDDWEKTAATAWFQTVQSFLNLGKTRLERLESIRTAAVGIQVDLEVRLEANLRCQTAPKAEALQAALVGPPGAEPPGVKPERNGELLTVQWKSSLDGILKALK